MNPQDLSQKILNHNGKIIMKDYTFLQKFL